MYLVFAVALVIGLMPLTVGPVAAQSVTLEPADADNVWGALPHRVCTVGWNPATDAVVGWSHMVTHSGWPTSFDGTAGAIGNEQCYTLTANADTQWQDSPGAHVDVQIELAWTRDSGSGPEAQANLTALKEWHEDCNVVLEACGRSTEVIWEESTKTLQSGNEVVKLIDTLCNDERGDGAVVHWFVTSGPTDPCVTVNAADQKGVIAGQKRSMNQALVPDVSVDNNQDEVTAAAAACLGVTPDTPVTYVRSVTSNNPDVQFENPPQTCSMGHGTSWIQLDTKCEGKTRIVAVVEYPITWSYENWKFDCYSINWWTQQRTKVPEIRWAGEKIVLEKNFGFPDHPVCFSLEDQSVGALERVSGSLSVPNYPQSSDTVWTYADTNGTARCILVSEDPGEADVDLALYELIGPSSQPGELINEHGFVVYFLKFESITLTEVLGERMDNPLTTCEEGHNSGLWDNPNPWDPVPVVVGTAEAVGDSPDPFLTETGAFAGMDLAGLYVAILDDVAGKGVPSDPQEAAGAGLVRKIVSHDDDTLLVDGCWAPTDLDTMPRQDAEYQVGGDLLPGVHIQYTDPYPVAPLTTEFYDETSIEQLNVSQDALLRVRVKGFFENANPSMRAGYPISDIVQEGWVDVDRDGAESPYDYRLPDGRWVLPHDWPYLAGPDWMVDRPYWDIMDNPFDNVKSLDDVLGPFETWGTEFWNGRDWDVQVANPLDPTDPTNTVVGERPVIGPYNNLDDHTPFLNPNVPTSLGLINDPPEQLLRKTILRNGVLDEWDPSMPVAKVDFVIEEGGPGFFKEVDKGDVYYEFVDQRDEIGIDGLVFTNPFYATEIPAHELLPPFLNNSEVDWASWGDPPNVLAQGPYFFWTIANAYQQPIAEFPRRVSVFTDNHGEAMVWLNGLSDRSTLLDPDNTILELLPDGQIDAPVGLRIGNTTVYAYVDYPYLTGKHPKLKSNDIDKRWIWGKHVLGMGKERSGGMPDEPYGPFKDGLMYSYPYEVRMVFELGNLDPGPPWQPNGKKMVFIWVSDADGLPAVGERVLWRVDEGVDYSDDSYLPDGAPWANTYTEGGVVKHLPVDVDSGFLHDTNSRELPGMYDPAEGKRYAESFLRTPDSWEMGIFAKFLDDYVPTAGPWPACLDVDDFAVAAVVLEKETATGTDSLSAYLDEGPIVGTIERRVYLEWNVADDPDDPVWRGDADMNDSVNMGDVTAVERMVLGLAPKSTNADANQSGAVDMGDVTKIERIILGR